MVLRLKTWESRSPPGLPSTPQKPHSSPPAPNPPPHAGWSSPVARQAHNLKVAGSNPAPATNPPPQARPHHPPGVQHGSAHSLTPASNTKIVSFLLLTTTKL